MAFERGAHPVEERTAQRIAPFRPVQRHMKDALARLDDQLRLVQALFP
jgi:hypothetical protein